MRFTDRTEAGQLLADKLKKYKDKDIVVYALPRGGVVTALEIAKYLDAPLDLVITRKIGHPYQPEYAIAAVAENGHIVGTQSELESVDKKWLKEEIERQKQEAKRRRKKYLAGREKREVHGKVAILVDDGIATGLTMRAGIKELQHRHPKKIVIAVPVIPQSTSAVLKKEKSEVIALDVPPDDKFLGAVGSYYEDFSPVEDEEVIAILKTYDKQRKRQTEKILPYAPQAFADPTVFVFPSHKYMVKSLKEIPNTILATFTLERFANGELHIQLHTSVFERDCVVVGSIAPPETNLVSFLFLCHTLEKENARSITAVLPYLAYSRQDKKEHEKSYATALIGSLLSTSGVQRVITVDVHNPHVTRLFSIPLISLSPAKIFAEEIRKLSLQDVTIIAPDEGARQRAEAVAKEAGIQKEVSYVVKKRTADGVKCVELHGEVTENIVIIDDILDTGKTLIACCEKLTEKGVKKIYIMITHGLFTENVWQKLWDLGVNHMYCTDTAPFPPYIDSNRVTVLSIQPLLVGELTDEYSV